MFSHLLALDSMSATIYAMIVASLLPLICSGLSKMLGKFTITDNADPRRFTATLQGAAWRAHAAEKNGFETLPFFLASVIMAHIMVVPLFAIAKLAWLYVFFRIAYSAAYIMNLPSMRTSLWLISFACPCLLFWLCLKI